MDISMKGFILITNRKKLLICLAAILFIILAAMLITSLNFPADAEFVPTLADTSSAENQNLKLKKILSSILPKENKILYEDKDRNSGSSPSSQKDNVSIQASDVLTKGRNLEYITVFSDEEYLRPIYSTSWKQAYFRGWLYLPNKLSYARHTLFTYPGSAGDIFDFEGELGFYPNISIDTQNYYNFLIYNFDLQNVVQLENQIVISGTTLKKGVQIISVKVEDVTIGLDNPGNIAVQLCTPSGYEIDFQNVRSEDYSFTREFQPEVNDNGVGIFEQNQLLMQELTYYISNSDNTVYFQHNRSYMTSDVLNSNIDLDEALEYSKSINFNISYEDVQYERPVYHPLWKEHYLKEWCYIPRKMYLNMKKLFVLPSDKDVAADLCGELAFFEEYPDIRENQVGILVYNFSVQSLRIYDDNLLLTGVPSRQGVQIIEVPSSKLKESQEYAVRLITKDLCEIDTDVIKN